MPSHDRNIIEYSDSRAASSLTQDLTFDTSARYHLLKITPILIESFWNSQPDFHEIFIPAPSVPIADRANSPPSPSPLPSFPHLLPTMPATTAETLSLVTRTVSVAPLVLLSAADHFGRSGKGVRKRVVGVLLGQNDGKNVRVSNSFAGMYLIPHLPSHLLPLKKENR